MSTHPAATPETKVKTSPAWSLAKSFLKIKGPSYMKAFLCAFANDILYIQHTVYTYLICGWDTLPFWMAQIRSVPSWPVKF